MNMVNKNTSKCHRFHVRPSTFRSPLIIPIRCRQYVVKMKPSMLGILVAHKPCDMVMRTESALRMSRMPSMYMRWAISSRSEVIGLRLERLGWVSKCACLGTRWFRDSRSRKVTTGIVMGNMVTSAFSLWRDWNGWFKLTEIWDFVGKAGHVASNECVGCLVKVRSVEGTLPDAHKEGKRHAKLISFAVLECGKRETFCKKNESMWTLHYQRSLSWLLEDCHFMI